MSDPLMDPDAEVLARWSGWGALPQVFDDRSDQPWAVECRRRLRELLTDAEFRAASRSTINAHYTSPMVASSMWGLLEGLGWNGSQVFEPGMGIGVFAATAPAGVTVTGVELDPVTARLARRLHHRHVVINENLAVSRADGSFDAAIGNVPFANVKIHDPVLSPNRVLSLHNYSIAKALASVAPGAPVLVITSKFTLDALRAEQRTQLASMGSFVGAVRLPASAFAEQAGTGVTTDLLVLRRLGPDEEPTPARWGSPAPVAVAGQRSPLSVNSWFVDHPELVVGEWAVSGLDGASVGVELRAEEFEERLRSSLSALEGLAKPAFRRLPMSALSPPLVADPVAVDAAGGMPGWVKPGGLWGSRATGFFQRSLETDGPVEFEPKPKRDAEALEQLIAVRDGYVKLVAAETDGTDDIEVLRDRLNESYDRFVSVNGPINQRSVSVRRDGVEVTRRPSFGGFRLLDPDFGTVAGLELFDPSSGQATKADIFSVRQIRPGPVMPEVGSVEDAVMFSLHRFGEIVPSRVAEVMNLDVDEVDRKLAQVAFRDPMTNRWVDRVSYLSGNVRVKLDQARAAGFGANVEALEAVMPAELAIEDIHVELGVSWLSPDEVLSFMRDTFDHPLPSLQLAYHPNVGWVPNFGSRSYVGEALTSTWGTDRMNAIQLVEAGLRAREIRIFDEVPHGDSTRRVLNYEATVTASQKLDEINRALGDWVADDAGRAARIAERYNRLFNSHVVADYQGWPRPVGLAESIELRAHQASVVTRMVMTGATGMYHVVGAGKTYSMASSAMELRRLGLAKKPLLVAPAHLVDQIAGEWLRAFPSAKLLVQTESNPQARARLVSQAAAADWDGIILSGPTFASIPVTARAEADYIEQRANDLREAFEAIESVAPGRTLKGLEKRIASAEERIKELLDKPRDPALVFESMGVDALFVDEAHYYKNLEVVTGRDSLAVAASQRAADLDLKLGLLRRSNPRVPVMLSTGTPISNSFHEMWVMMRLVAPDLLESAGLDRFDGFASQFGQMATDYEMTASGQFKLKSRFASFKNVPELQALFGQNADVRLAADLDLPTPGLEGGKRHHLRVPASKKLQAFVAELDRRTQAIDPRTPEVDNHLAILTDARKAALSLELVGRADPPVNKLSVLAEAVAARYRAEKDLRYRDARSGEVSPKRGSLQIVFMDQGVPGAGVDLYSKLASELGRRGVPEDRVAFVHDAKPAELRHLFSRCRDGDVAVLVGSTAKMGTGMNVQTRATALYHVDPPWRPADMEQRDGRVLRQGNQNSEVGIYYVINEGSGDVLSYQALERKAKMIGQVLSGKNTARTVEAIDGAESTFGDLKALATGDPKVLELLRAKRALGLLQISKNEWERRVLRAQRRLVGAEQLEASLVSRLERLVGLDQALPGVRKVVPAAGSCEGLVSDQIRRCVPKMPGSVPRLVARVGRVEVFVVREVGSRDVLFNAALPDRRSVQVLRVPSGEVATADLARRLRNSFDRLAPQVAEAQDRLDRARRDHAQAEANRVAPFTKASEFSAAQRHVLRLEAEVAAEYNGTEVGSSATFGPSSEKLGCRQPIQPDETTGTGPLPAIPQRPEGRPGVC